MITLATILAAFWLLSLLAFGVMAVWSVFPDPAADGRWDDEPQGYGVGAGSGANETASTPASASPSDVHAIAQD